jgi:hypothetical protein
MKNVLDGTDNGQREQLIQEGNNLLVAARVLAGL